MEETKNVQLSMEQLETLLKNGIAGIAAELGAGKVERKNGVFPDTTPQDMKELTKEQRVNKFIRAVAKGDVAVQKALSEGTTTAGGFLVPEEFRLAVIRVAEEYGLIRRLANVFPTGLDTINLAASNAENTVAWISENSIITETTASFTSPTIAIKKLAGITAMSKELFNDEKANLLSFISGVFGEDIAKKEDQAGLIGDGTSTYGSQTGLLNVSGINALAAPSGATSYFDFTADDYLDTIFQSAMTGGSRSGGAFVMHPIVFSKLRKVKTSGSGEYVVQMPTAPGVPPSIWGYPIEVSEVMPSTDAAATKFVGFANFRRHCYFADRQSMELTIGTEGTVGSNNLFEKDMLALRVVNRVGLVWVLGAKLASLKTN